jgi:hypothetical protein
MEDTFCPELRRPLRLKYAQISHLSNYPDMQDDDSIRLIGQKLKLQHYPKDRTHSSSAQIRTHYFLARIRARRTSNLPERTLSFWNKQGVWRRKGLSRPKTRRDRTGAERRYCSAGPNWIQSYVSASTLHWTLNFEKNRQRDTREVKFDSLINPLTNIASCD